MTPSLCRAALERFPFGVVFAKEAPQDATRPVDYDHDFCYHYFSPGLNYRSHLRRVDMCTGSINAKHDFDDYERYFHDDIDVMKKCHGNRVLARVEPWRPPGADFFVYTRKTAMVSAMRPYLLSVFERVDGVVLGLATESSAPYDALSPLPALSKPMDDAWFADAVRAFPGGLGIMSPDAAHLDATSKAWPADADLRFAGAPVAIDALHGCINRALHERHWDHAKLTRRAVWLTGLLRDTQGRAIDIGAYDILVHDVAKRVLFLRPAMADAASPRYRAEWVAA